MGYILMVMFMLSTSCGKTTHNVEFDEIEGGTENKVHFSPDFEAWETYCTGKVDHEIKAGEFTENERDYEIAECYYNIDLEFPPLPEQE